MLIGLAGTAGAGKDTVYEMLRDIYGGQVVRESFAERLKISAAHALGVDHDEVEFCNRIKQPHYRIEVKMPDGSTVKAVSGREFLQRYGTEAHRDVFGQDFWINAVLPGGWQPTPGELTVITDVRFANEASRVRECGGVVWEIVRNAQIAETTHSSEQALPRDLIDLVILNSGTLDDLMDEVVVANRTLMEVRV